MYRRTLLAMLLCVGVVGAQQSGTLIWNPNGSNVTINAPTTAGTVLTYGLPARSGTLALTTDLTAGPTIASGSITLSNGTGATTVPTSAARCVLSDGSGNSVKYARLGTTLTVFGVGPIVDYACF